MDKPGGISSEAVKAKTGKSWDDWLKTLDKEGAKKLSHKEIAALVHSRYNVGGWWSQMITVGYEQARGLREVHQKTDGFSANVSRTFNAPLETLYESWSDAKKRKRWIGDGTMTVRKATENKSIRITWSDGTNLDVNFYPKGDAKSQVSLECSKLPDAASVQSRKAWWSDALARLKSQLES
jgi:hypothetical protein